MLFVFLIYNLSSITMHRAISNIISSLEELNSILSPINDSKNLNRLLDTEPVIAELSYKTLPPQVDIKAIKDININNLRLTGEVRPVDWKTIDSVFIGLKDDVGMNGRVSIDIHYEEQNNELSNDGAEYARIIMEYGKYYFGYSAGGTRMALDREHAINVFTNMFSVMGLPIVLTNEGEYYTLQHKNNLSLELSDSLLGRNPVTFSFELTDIDARQLIDKLKIFEEKLILGDILGVDWTAGHSARTDGAKPGTTKVVDIYNAVIGIKPSAINYTMQPTFDVISLLGLETIRGFCTENNFAKARYGVINFGKTKALISISASNDGFFIEAGTKDKGAIENLSSTLNIDFEQN